MSYPPEQTDILENSPRKNSGLGAFFRRNQQRIGIVVTVLIFILALFTFAHLVEDIDRKSLTTAFGNVSWYSIGLAIIAATTSYLMILGYEWSASHYANAKLPIPTLALGGLSAAAIGNALGFSMLTGGTVRYRIYSKKNISALAIIQMTIFASLSLGLALPPIAALMSFTDVTYSAKALHMNETLLIIVASLVILGYIIFLAVASRFISPEHPSKDSRYLCFGLLNIRVPSMRITMLQFLITFLDMLAAGTVLYCLLPASADIPFGTFLTVYLLALAAGVLSHVPGGLGVFEVVLLAAFQSQLDKPSLLAALFLYRFIYVIMPLIIACMTLLIVEARRFASTRQTSQISTAVAPVISLFVFISGILLILSSIIPEPAYKLDTLFLVSPSIVINGAHVLASLTGVCCLIVAHGLWRRLHSAWNLSFLLISMGIMLVLISNLDWLVALFLIFTLGILATFRKIFYRASALLDIVCSIPTLITTGCMLAIAIWFYMFTYRHTPFTIELWWHFDLYSNAGRGLRAITADIILFVVIIITWLLHTSPPKIFTPTTEQLEQAKKITLNSNQPNGALFFSKDKDILFNTSKDAFIMYACHDRTLIALSDPIGNPKYYNELIWQFRDYCDLHNARPVFYQINAKNISHYMDIGLTIIKLGDEITVELSNLDIEQEDKTYLKQIWQVGNTNNLSLKIYNAGELSFDKIKTIIDSSPYKKQEKIRGFSLGKLTENYLQNFRIATIDYRGEMIAFANLLETDTKQLAKVDLIQAVPNAPKLTIEYLLAATALKLKEEGIKHFSLGLSPVAELKPHKNAPLAFRLGSLAFRRSYSFYNVAGLNRFKEKFHPNLEARYIAIPPGVDPFIILTDIAALIAGNINSAVTHGQLK